MILVIGLGNPGDKYTNTRHNIGFMVVDSLASNLSPLPLGEDKGEGNWKKEVNSFIFHTQVGGKKVLLAKPQTYMNLSGNTVKSILNKFDLKVEDIIVIYDDIDLPFGEIRVRKGGGTAGHNGIESIVESIGTKDCIRIRVGIGRPQSPHTSPSPLPLGEDKGEGKTNIADYVLEEFTPQEKEKLPEIIQEATKKTRLLLKFGYEHFTSKYN